MRTIGEIKGECREHGICADYLERWDRCSSAWEMFTLGCSTEGLSFLMRGASEGWGFSQDEIRARFGKYINGGGACVNGSVGRTYDSALWVGYDGPVSVAETCAGLIGCRCEVSIAPMHACYLFLDRASSVVLKCPESSWVIVENYGGSVELGACAGRITIHDCK